MGLISNLLNNKVNSKKKEAFQYNADINKCINSIADLKKAKQLFEESGSKMDGLILETDGVFQGDAAIQFCNNLTQYNKVVKEMPYLIDQRIKSLEKRISSLKNQRGWSEFWGNMYEGLMSPFRFFGL